MASQNTNFEFLKNHSLAFILFGAIISNFLGLENHIPVNF
jgi:hypothetical protein